MSRPATVIRVVRWFYAIGVAALITVMLAWFLLILAFTFGGPIG